jgi:hypothetical protein
MKCVIIFVCACPFLALLLAAWCDKDGWEDLVRDGEEPPGV